MAIDEAAAICVNRRHLRKSWPGDYRRIGPSR
jgi:hypothetical protein